MPAGDGPAAASDSRRTGRSAGRGSARSDGGGGDFFKMLIKKKKSARVFEETEMAKATHVEMGDTDRVGRTQHE